MSGASSGSGNGTNGLLAGRRGVILGVSSENSIGYQVARTLRTLGASLTLTCRPGRVDQVAPLAARVDASLLTLDVDDEPSMARAFEQLGQDGQRLDFLVHSVVNVPEGVLARSLLEVRRNDFEHVLSVAAWSLVAACRYARPLLLRSPAPRVVALTSACGHRMTPHYHVAGIAKAALESAVLYLAMQLGKEGILVNAVGSSLLATDGAVRAVGADNAAGTRAVQAKKSATGRAIDFEDVAGTIAFLCSPLARNLTGEVVTVDGGFSRSYF
jgi:enoyl-[acyl-carrier protein] reductase I